MEVIETCPPAQDRDFLLVAPDGKRSFYINSPGDSFR
jgi:hypothetical protein